MKHKPQPHAPSLFDDIVMSALVPEDHLLRRVDRAVDFSFVHDVLDDEYDGNTGRPAYNPEVLVRLIFLQLEYNLSDRGVITRAQTDMAFRGFLGLNHDDDLPHPSTLTHFRDRVGEDGFRVIFGRILGQAKALGIVTNRRVMIDSYTVEADIGVPRFWELVEQATLAGLDALDGTGGLEDETTYLREECGKLQADNSYLLSKEHSKLLLEERLALAKRVLQLLEDLEATQTQAQSNACFLLSAVLKRSANHGKKNIKKDDILSLVDPDARWSRKQRGKKTVAGYREQLAVDVDSGMVTNVGVDRGNTDDSQALQSMVDGHIDNVGSVPEEVVTDSKYQSGENRAYLASEGIGDYIAAPSPKGSKQGKYSPADFDITFDDDGNALRIVCPHGEEAEDPTWRKATHSWVFQFKEGQCRDCPLRDQCMKPPKQKRQGKKKGKHKQRPVRVRGRQVSVDRHYQLTQQARERQASDEGQTAQIERLDIERRFSYQQRHGGKRTRYRGLVKNKMMGWLWGIYLNVRQLLSIVEDLFESTEEMAGAKLYNAAAGPLPGKQCA